MKPLFIVVMTARGLIDCGTHGIYEIKADAERQADLLAINNGDNNMDYEVRRLFLNTASPVELTAYGAVPIADVVHTANYKHFQKKLNEHTKENIK